MLIKADDLRHFKDDVEYWVYPFLQKKGSLFFGAPPKHLKTMLAMQLGYSLSTGRDFLGWKTSAGSVLYIEQEIGVSVTKDRYERIRQHYGDDKVDLTFWTRDRNRLSLDVGTTGRSALHDMIKAIKPSIVIFDPFRKMTGADENSSTEMTKVFASLTELQETFNFASVLIHHTAKPSDQRRACEPEALRGSSEIFAHGDSYGIFCNLKHDTEIDVHWTFRNHAPIDPFRLEFNSEAGVFNRRHDSPKAASKGCLSDGLVKAAD